MALFNRSWPLIALTVLVGGVALLILLKLRSRPRLDTPEVFWKELELNQRLPLPAGPVVINGKKIAESLESIQLKMFSSCAGRSQLFFERIEKGLRFDCLLDLGCGIGPNSLPLALNGIRVIAIDKVKELLDIYQNSCGKRVNTTFTCADLTELKSYANEASMDVALAVDVLPYLPTSTWKSTMEKIVRALKPGGYFFGTVFVKGARANEVVAVHERFGANYYTIDNLAERLIRHSGLELVECRLRKGSYGCYEFVARKP